MSSILKASDYGGSAEQSEAAKELIYISVNIP